MQLMEVHTYDLDKVVILHLLSPRSLLPRSMASQTKMFNTRVSFLSGEQTTYQTEAADEWILMRMHSIV